MTNLIVEQDQFVKFAFKNIQYFEQIRIVMEEEVGFALYDNLLVMIGEFFDAPHEHDQWNCFFSLYSDGGAFSELWFAPNHWGLKPKKDKKLTSNFYWLNIRKFDAYFSLRLDRWLDADLVAEYSQSKRICEDCIPIRHFFQNNNGQMVFLLRLERLKLAFLYSEKVFEGAHKEHLQYGVDNPIQSLSDSKVMEDAWKEHVSAFNRKHPELEQLGFKFSDFAFTWYLPLEKLDPMLVAEHYVNKTLVEALNPIKDALEKIKQAYPIFNQFIEETNLKIS